MHVQPGYSGKEGVHNAPPEEVRRQGTSRSVALCSACSPTAGGNNPGYGSTSGPDSKAGSQAPMCVGLRLGGDLLHHQTSSASFCQAPFSSSRVPLCGMNDSKLRKSLDSATPKRA